MEKLEPQAHYDKETILKDLIRVIRDMMEDSDLEFSNPITRDTCLIADLNFESLDIVVLIGEIQNPHRFFSWRHDSLDIESFMLSREWEEDLPISTLVDFLYDHSFDGAKTESLM
jgi:hypothetical protein